MSSAAGKGCASNLRKSASAGGQLEHPSEVKSSTTTGTRLTDFVKEVDSLVREKIAAPKTTEKRMTAMLCRIMSWSHRRDDGSGCFGKGKVTDSASCRRLVMLETCLGQAPWQLDRDRLGNDRNCQSSRAEKRHRRGKLPPSSMPKIVILIDNTELIE